MTETTPETSDLRNRLAEAMQNHDWRAGDGNEYGLTSRHANHRFHWLCAVCAGDTERMADALLPVVAQEIAAAERARVEAVRQVGANIGPYRAAQSAIGDLDREHIDVLEVGTILSNLRREVSDMYRAALVEPAAEEHP